MQELVEVAYAVQGRRTVTSASFSPARWAFRLGPSPVFGTSHKPLPNYIQADVAHGAYQVFEAKRL